MSSPVVDIQAMDYPDKREAREDYGPVHEIWRILREDRTALIGFFIIVGLIGVAISAPWIAPYDYTDQHIVHSPMGHRHVLHLQRLPSLDQTNCFHHDLLIPVISDQGISD